MIYREKFLRFCALVDVLGIPSLILAYIWELQFAAPRSWIAFVVWLTASFLLHRDSPESLGWRADNLGPATVQAAVAFGGMSLALFFTGVFLGAPLHVPPNLGSIHRFWAYVAFCLLQQVALNSFLMNRLLFLINRRPAAAMAAGAIFAACHWPNPVLVPLTFAGGAVMAWLFARHRNILPLALGQAVLGSIVWWSFPLAWHHRLRVGPGYYTLPWK